MIEIIMKVLDDLQHDQINLASESARKDIAVKIVEQLNIYIEKLFSKDEPR